MSGVTLELRPWQVKELAGIARGDAPARRPDNLMRRGFVERTDAGYRLTTLGRVALDAA